MNGIIFHHQDFEDATYVNRIGNGSFGIVHKLKRKTDNNYYAVKIINGEDNNELRDDFISEIQVISKLSYPTLLKFHGITFSYPYFLISDFVPNHSVQYFIDKAFKGHTEKGWNLTNKFIIILGISLGMEYLHSMNVVHQDLKPRNILLENNFYPKICDFNLSKTIYSSAKCSTGSIGTIEFCAPEVLEEENQYDGKKADVYSFGMMLYSIIYDSIPYHNIKQRAKVLLAILAGKRPELKETNEFKLFNFIIQKCWNPEPNKRPKFEKITKALIKIKNTIGQSKKTIIEEKEVDKFLKFCSSSQNCDMSEQMDMSKEVEQFYKDYEKAKEEEEDMKSNLNRTPLHYAALKNLKNIGEILISKGADINAKDIIYLNIEILFLINGI